MAISGLTALLALAENKEWEIEDIVEEKVYEGDIYYSVKWTGWLTEYNQWVMANEVKALKALKAFRQRKRQKKLRRDS